jgi:hypothetical protein
MLSLIKIPQGVDLVQPHLVAAATLFKDALKDWQDLGNNDYFIWQEFILRNGSDVKLESDSWLDNTLQLSLETALCAEVASDLCSIPLS